LSKVGPDDWANMKDLESMILWEVLL